MPALRLLRSVALLCLAAGAPSALGAQDVIDIGTIRTC